MTVGITELPPEGMQLGGVALAGDSDRGTRTTEGLSLLFTTAGITVQGPQPQIERLLVWSGLDSAVCREKIDLPDGRNAVVLELRSGGQSIRFLLPMDAVTPGQAAYLDQALPAWLARYKGSRGSSEPAVSAPPSPEPSAPAPPQPAAPAAEAPAGSAQPGNGTGPEASTLGAAAAAASATTATGPATQPPPPLSFRFPTPSRTASGEGAVPTASEPAAGQPADPALLGGVGTALPPQQPGTNGPTAGSNGLAGETALDRSSTTTEHEQLGRSRGTKDDATVAAVAAAGATGALAGGAKVGGASLRTSTAESTPVDTAPPPPLAPFGSPGSGVVDPERAAAKTSKNNRTVLVVLLVVLLAAIGGIAYFATKKSSTTTAGTAVVNPAPSRATADAALAGSINLKRADLPADWKPVSVAARAPLPVPAPPVAAQVAALRTMSSCVGQPFAVLAGLLGDGTVPGTSAAVTSPTFASGADPGIRMVSTTTVTGTVVDNRVLAAPFANPAFATCYAGYQSALATAAVRGGTASVQTVSLPAPAGVTTFAYLTTFNLPGYGNQVLGEAFIFGGRIVNRLVPFTNGPPVPQSTFAQAYDSITARLASALHR